MSVAPAYAAIPVAVEVNFATANTNRDGTGTIATLLGAITRPTRVERILIRAAGTTTAGVIRFWYKSTSGGTWRLVHELLVTAITPSASIAVYLNEWAPTNGLNMPTLSMLGVSTHNAETFNALALGGEI
jgi:hypothetical protein